MKAKKVFCLLLACVLAFGCLTMNAGAVQAETAETPLMIERASGRFSTDIDGQELVAFDTTFPLDIGETVTIRATYSPRSASVDFGLLTPDGTFYLMRAEKGSFNETIKIDQRGNYALAIRNNSDSTVSVSGTVTY